MNTKLCKKCGIEKSLDEFYFSNKPLGYRRSECNTCSKQIKNLYYNNNKEKCNNYGKEYYYKNTKYFREHKKLYTECNKDRIRKCEKEWVKNNRKKRIMYENKRRELKKNTNSNITYFNLETTYLLFGHKCFKCKSDKKLCLDHNKPLSRGYGLSSGNITILCAYCNSKKGSKMPEEFYTKEELYTLNILLEKQKLRAVEDY